MVRFLNHERARMMWEKTNIRHLMPFPFPRAISKNTVKVRIAIIMVSNAASTRWNITAGVKHCETKKISIIPDQI